MPHRFPIGGGTFVAAVGPSGAGKDTIMRMVRQRLAGRSDLHVARRCITRPADGHEDHEPITDAAFQAKLAAGGFVLAWQAHGLHYGIPVDVDDLVRAGNVVVANLSRTALAAMRARYCRALTVEITASPEIRQARLAGRGREDVLAVAGRLSRSVAIETTDDTIVIDNSDDPKFASDAFYRLLVDELNRLDLSTLAR